MGSIIRLASCLVSVATIFLKCVQQLEWTMVFLCCFVKLRSHCCCLCNLQRTTKTLPTKTKQKHTLVICLEVDTRRSGKHRSYQGGKPKVDASQMLPRCSPNASIMSSLPWVSKWAGKKLFGVSRWGHYSPN